jgi:hypothetical protein
LAAIYPPSAPKPGERALEVEDVDAVHQSFALADSAAARAIQADGVDLVDTSHRFVLIREIAGFGDRRYISDHRVKAPEGDQFRALPLLRDEQLFEIGYVMCRNTCFSHPVRLMPSSIELWFSASERIRQSGNSDAMVKIPARLEIQPEVKTSAASSS